jgi:hypothetical protein
MMTSMIAIGQTLICLMPIFTNVHSDGVISPAISRKRCVYRGFNLGNAEGVTRHFRERLGVDEELVAKHRLELAHVHFGHEDMFEALQ